MIKTALVRVSIDRFGKSEYRPNSGGFNYSGGAESQFKPKSGCFICGGIGHKAFTCPQWSGQQNQHKDRRNSQQHRVAACQVVEEREDEDEWSDRKVNIPGIGSVRMIAAMSNSIEDGRRQVLNMRRNHNSYGLVNGMEVELLRDTGSSVSIVRSALVKPEQYTGREIT